MDFVTVGHPNKSKKDKKASDITIYGCTSFVAKHVITYLVQTSISLHAPLRITLAGRNPSKVQQLSDEWNNKMKLLLTTLPESEVVVQKGKCIFDTCIADCHDQNAVQVMVDRTRVILNCAGPFAQYGSTVVESCAKLGTDYCDITGEVSWVGAMRRQHGAAAAQSGARIVSLCGYDSIPSDLAVYAAVQALRKESPNKKNGVVEIERATTWHSAFGGANGGTVKTIQEMPIDFKKCLSHGGWLPFLLDDPLVLCAPSLQDDPASQTWRHKLVKAEWMNQLPFFHSFLKGGVSAPFFMTVCNAKVVHASAAALHYGGKSGKDNQNDDMSDNNKFCYYERFLPVGFRGTTQLQTFSFIPAFFTHVFLLMGIFLLRLPIIGPWLTLRLYPPGSGLSDPMCAAGYAELYAEVQGPVQPNGRVDKANCFMKFRGDPGNFVTAQCVSEAALTMLLTDPKELPPLSKDGFGTPAELLGEALLMRLRKARVRRIEFCTHVRKNTTQNEWQMFP